jgi:hypothetical protein
MKKLRKALTYGGLLALGALSACAVDGGDTQEQNNGQGAQAACGDFVPYGGTKPYDARKDCTEPLPEFTAQIAGWDGTVYETMAVNACKCNSNMAFAFTSGGNSAAAYTKEQLAQAKAEPCSKHHEVPIRTVAPYLPASYPNGIITSLAPVDPSCASKEQ